MRHRAILVGLFAAITLQSGSSLALAGEKEATATIQRLGGTLWQTDFDPDKTPDLVAFWLRPALSDADTEKAAGALEQLPRLRTLILDCTQITDKGLAHLTSLTRLTELSLKATRVTDAGLKHLERLTSLKKVNLRLTAVSQRGVVALRKALPRAVIEQSRFDELPAEAVRLRGRWRCVSVRGDSLDPERPERFTLVVVGDELARIQGDLALIYICRIEFEASARPKAMRLFITDVVPGFNSRTDRLRAVYKLEGDTLTLCVGSWDSPPREFSNEEGTLYVYKRVDAMNP
jgi:uncharacterized protein (TIGR03067 family)